MAEAPKRAWLPFLTIPMIRLSIANNASKSWPNIKHTKDVAYVRADIADEMVARAEVG